MASRRPHTGALRVSPISKATGLEAKDPPQQLTSTQGDTALKEFNKTWDNPLRVEIEQSIRTDLTSRGLTAPNDREEALIRALAGAQITLHFERIYSTIFASQVAILVHLISLPDGVPSNSLRQFYEAAAKQAPAFFAEYPFERYLGFLESNSLLARQGDLVALSTTGREFLKYLVDARKTMPSHG